MTLSSLTGLSTKTAMIAARPRYSPASTVRLRYRSPRIPAMMEPRMLPIAMTEMLTAARLGERPASPM